MMQWIRSTSLTVRIVAITLIILATVVTVNYIVFVRGYEHSAHEALVEKAAAFTAVADAAKNHAAKLNKLGAFDSKTLLSDLAADRAAGRNYADSRIFGTIPVVAGWQSADEAADREGIAFQVSAFQARNKDNEPKPGTFEHTLLTDLSTQVKQGGDLVISRVDADTNQLHYLRAIQLTADCMLCHGDPRTSPTADGKDVLGFVMENWKPGDMHGAYHVVLPLAPVDQQVASFIGTGLLWTIPLCVVGVVAFVLLLKGIFSRPVKLLIDRIRDIAEGEGDLTQRISVNSNDEVGQLGRWFNAFVERIHDLIVQVGMTTREVASAATQIAASSEEMAQGMNEQSQQVMQISAAVEEMSASVVEVARKSGDAAGNAQESESAAREGGRVVEQTVDGMRSISSAVREGAASVEQLGKRGEQIGQIISVINDIADQTNLLALNAAIEAARAGEHGRGFAVVADEVRKLADRTTKATDEIATSIEAIQTETRQAVDRMNAGTEQVEHGVERATIAGASLQKIVSGAQEVAAMIQSIAAAAEQQSAAAEQVSRNIESISAVTRQSSEGTQQASSAAAQLSQKAEQLQALVNRFRVSEAARAQSAIPARDDTPAKPTLGGKPDLKSAARAFKRSHVAA